MSRLRGAWFRRPATQRLCGLFAGAGHRIYFVGGCVRNDLLGAPVADIDLTTDATPETVMNLADSAGIRAVPTGLAHGTVTLVVDGIAHEVTTLRHDVETDGRHARIRFADSIEDDAARRDFTINALYATPEGVVLDPLGTGFDDLARRRLRFVGEPQARIAEDRLRILRFFRFHAWYGASAEGFDPDGLRACTAAAAGVDDLSRERVGAEMRKLLAAPNPAPAVAAMHGAGVLTRLLPDARPDRLAALIAAERLYEPAAAADDGADDDRRAGVADTRHVAPRWLARLAALGGGAQVADGLRLSRKEARSLAALNATAVSDEPVAALGYRLGAALGARAVVLRAAWEGRAPPDDWQAELARGAAAEFPVGAADLMPAFRGPALGRRLEALRARWLASGLRLGREELLD